MINTNLLFVSILGLILTVNSQATKVNIEYTDVPPLNIEKNRLPTLLSPAWYNFQQDLPTYVSENADKPVVKHEIDQRKWPNEYIVIYRDVDVFVKSEYPDQAAAQVKYDEITDPTRQKILWHQGVVITSSDVDWSETLVSGILKDVPVEPVTGVRFSPTECSSNLLCTKVEVDANVQPTTYQFYIRLTFAGGGITFTDLNSIKINDLELGSNYCVSETSKSAYTGSGGGAVFSQLINNCWNHCYTYQLGTTIKYDGQCEMSIYPKGTEGDYWTYCKDDQTCQYYYDNKWQPNNYHMGSDSVELAKKCSGKCLGVDQSASKLKYCSYSYCRVHCSLLADASDIAVIINPDLVTNYELYWGTTNIDRPGNATSPSVYQIGGDFSFWATSTNPECEIEKCTRTLVNDDNNLAYPYFRNQTGYFFKIFFDTTAVSDSKNNIGYMQQFMTFTVTCTTVDDHASATTPVISAIVSTCFDHEYLSPHLKMKYAPGFNPNQCKPFPMELDYHKNTIFNQFSLEGLKMESVNQQNETVQCPTIGYYRSNAPDKIEVATDDILYTMENNTYFYGKSYPVDQDYYNQLVNDWKVLQIIKTKTEPKSWPKEVSEEFYVHGKFLGLRSISDFDKTQGQNGRCKSTDVLPLPSNLPSIMDLSERTRIYQQGNKSNLKTDYCNLLCINVAECKSFNYVEIAGTKSCELFKLTECTDKEDLSGSNPDWSSRYYVKQYIQPNTAAYFYNSQKMHIGTIGYTSNDFQLEKITPLEAGQEFYSITINATDFVRNTECGLKIKSIKICEEGVNKYSRENYSGGIWKQNSATGRCEWLNKVVSWKQGIESLECNYLSSVDEISAPCNVLYFNFDTQKVPTYEYYFFLQIKLTNDQLYWSKTKRWQIVCGNEIIDWIPSAVKNFTLPSFSPLEESSIEQIYDDLGNIDRLDNPNYYYSDFEMVKQQISSTIPLCFLSTLTIFEEEARLTIIDFGSTVFTNSYWYCERININKFDQCQYGIFRRPAVFTIYGRAQDRSMQKNFDFDINVKVCGLEKLKASQAQHSFKIQSLQQDKILKMSELEDPTINSDPIDCPVINYKLSEQSYLVTLNGTFPNQQLTIHPSKIKESGIQRITFIAETKGLVRTDFYIQLDAEQVTQCLLCVINQSFGPKEALNQTILANNSQNVIERTFSEGFIMGPYIEFIFEDFPLTNISGGEACQNKDYQLKLSYYPSQSPLSTELGEPQEAEISFVRMNNQSMNSSELLDSYAMKHYSTEEQLIASASLKSKVEKLDKKKQYNMITMNPDQLKLKNMTYLIEITATQPVQIEDKSLLYLQRSINVSYQFVLRECRPVQFHDLSENQTAFSNVTEITYFINNGTVKLQNPFKEIISYQPDCGRIYKLNQEIDYLTGLNQKETDILKSLVQYNDSEGEFVINADTKSYLGQHVVNMKAQVQNLANPNEIYQNNATWSFQINVQIEEFEVIQNKPPFFSGSVPTQVEAQYNQTIESISLPAIKDNNSTQSVKLVLDSNASQFVRYFEETNSFNFTSFASLNLTKDIVINFSLQDDDEIEPLSSSYKITLVCKYCKQLVEQKKEVDEEKKEEQQEKVIKAKQNQAQIKVIEDLQDRKRQEEKDKLEQSQLLKTIAEDRDVKLPVLSIKPISSDGIMRMTFSKEMKYPDSWEAKHKEDKEILESLKQNSSRLLEETKLDKEDNLVFKVKGQDLNSSQECEWFIQTLEPKKVEISLYFEKPEEISISSQSTPDSLQIEFPVSLRDKDGLPLDMTNLGGQQGLIVTQLPTQLPKTRQTLLFKQNIKTAETSMHGIVIGNFLLATLVSFSLNYLWGLINTLQMIVYLPMFNIIFPANINLFNSIVIKVATFDIVPKIDDINEFLFKFKYTIKINELKAQGYSQLGFDTKNFIYNSGSLTLFVFGFILNAFILTILKKLAYTNMNFIQAYRYFSRNKVLIAIAIRFLLEGFIELFVSSLISSEMTSRVDLIFTNAPDIFAYVLSILFLVMILSLPILSVWIVKCKQKFLELAAIDQTQRLRYLMKQQETNLDNTWGIFYGGLRLNNNIALQYYVVYILRRFLFVLLAYYYEDFMFLQLQLNMALNLMLVSYLVEARALQSRSLNRIEIVNEFCVMLIGYLLLGFSDFVLVPSIKIVVGSWMVGLTSLNILFNFSLIAIKMVQVIKIKYLRKKAKEDYVRIQNIINKKYSAKEQRAILQSIKTGKTVEETKKDINIKMKAWKKKHVKYQLSESSESEIEVVISKPTLLLEVKPISSYQEKLSKQLKEVTNPLKEKRYEEQMLQKQMEKVQEEKEIVKNEQQLLQVRAKGEKDLQTLINLVPFGNKQ